LDIGKMRSRITIKQNTGTQKDSTGAVIPNWIDYVSVWAEKAHKTSRKFFAAQKVNAEVQELFTIWYRKDITTDMRVSFDGKIYKILGANDPDDTKVKLHIICKAVA